jgi:hypothetical protein
MKIKGVEVKDEDIKRLYDKITIITQGENEGCWEVDCCKDACGYSRMGIGKNNVMVHRFMYMLHHQDDDITGLEICHTCDNPWCCCPEHLFADTHQANMSDMVQKGRQNKGEKHRSAILTENDVKDVLDGIMDGKFTSVIQIAKHYNITRAPISTILYGIYWKHVTKDYDLIKIKNMIVNPNSRGGEAGKLTPDNIRDIRKRIANGESQASVAKIYNIDNTNISRIKLGKIHKNII